jgi:hypothetical protein
MATNLEGLKKLRVLSHTGRKVNIGIGQTPKPKLGDELRRVESKEYNPLLMPPR